MQNAFSIKDALSFAWKKTVDNIWFFALLTLAFFVIAGVLDKVGGDRFWISIARLLNMLLSYFATFTFVRFGLKAWKGQTLSYDEIFHVDWNLFGLYLLGALIFTLSYVVGFVLLIIPGIFVIIRLGFFAFILVEEKQKPMPALKRSFELTRGYSWHLFGLAIVLFVINLAGAIPFGVGLLITTPLCLLATVYVYEKLKVAPHPVVATVMAAPIPPQNPTPESPKPMPAPTSESK